MKKFIVFIFLFSFFFSCEEQMVVIPEIVPPDSDRVVLIEELTGVDCPNCPKGSTILSDLIAQFPGQVIGIGIHGDLLTNPISGSKYDFRTTFSQKIEESFGIFAKPCAVINRVMFPDQTQLEIYGEETWINFVQTELQKEPRIDLAVTSAYDSATRTASIEVKATGRENISDQLKISVVITEGNIEDPQKDQNEIIEDYKHNHVLRTMLTNWDGDGFSQGIDLSQTISQSYDFVVPEEQGLWKIEDLEVIAFITDDNGVLQAAEVHLSE